jgi:TPR repeat protein/predicted aspartyl protease
MKPKLFHILSFALILSGIFCVLVNAAEGQTNINSQPSTPDLHSVSTNFVAEHFNLISRRGFADLVKRAAKGDVKAQYEVGARYAEGEGVDENSIKAYKWLEKAARQGDARAERRVGEMLLSGTGTATNAEAGLKWLHKAAVQGDVYAQTDLGAYYMNGQFVPEDKEKAFHWFLAAARQGASVPERSVGAMYASGQGTTTNLQAGIKWLLQAAAQHEPQALFNLGHVYLNGLGVPEDPETAYNYFLKAAIYAQSDGLIEPQAVATLGVQLATGNGAPKDLKFGQKLLEFAAKAGDAEAQENLGKLLLAEHDYPKMFIWLNKAAHQGSGEAQFLVAYAYFNGVGVATNKIEALKWCCLAASQGYRQAQAEKDELLVFMSASDSRKAIKQAKEFQAKKEQIPPLDDSKVTVCPLGPDFMIPVKMFGATKHLLVDTGSGLTSLNEKYRAELGASLGQINMSGAFGTNLNLSIYRSPDMFIGDTALNEFWILGTDLEKISHKIGKPLDGVLGMAFLKNHLICFNPDEGKMRIGGTVPGWVKKQAQTIPLKRVPDKINQFSVGARINGMATVHLLVDSGSVGTDVSLCERDWQQIFPKGVTNLSTTNTVTLGDQVQVAKIIKLRSVIIGTNSYSNLTAQLIPGAKESSLGQGFIRKYVPAMDFPHQVLYLRPDHSTKTP